MFLGLFLCPLLRRGAVRCCKVSRCLRLIVSTPPLRDLGFFRWVAYSFDGCVLLLHHRRCVDSSVLLPGTGCSLPELGGGLVPASGHLKLLFGLVRRVAPLSSAVIPFWPLTYNLRPRRVYCCQHCLFAKESPCSDMMTRLDVTWYRLSVEFARRESPLECRCGCFSWLSPS